MVDLTRQNDLVKGTVEAVQAIARLIRATLQIRRCGIYLRDRTGFHCLREAGEPIEVLPSDDLDALFRELVTRRAIATEHWPRGAPARMSAGAGWLRGVGAS